VIPVDRPLLEGPPEASADYRPTPTRRWRGRRCGPAATRNCVLWSAVDTVSYVAGKRQVGVRLNEIVANEPRVGECKVRVEMQPGGRAVVVGELDTVAFGGSASGSSTGAASWEVRKTIVTERDNQGGKPFARQVAPPAA
jgi:hypothetical protein